MSPRFETYLSELQKENQTDIQRTKVLTTDPNANMDTGPTAPIDLTQNTNGVCSLKCSYSFNYPPTNLQITNHGSYLSMTVDNTTTPPVIYNDQNYNVQEVRLYQPSLHTFADKHVDAELVILHANNISTKQLLVCIPVLHSGTSTMPSASYFDLIMVAVQRTANSQGQQTSVSNPTLSLAKFVPMTPYYSYSGTLPWEPFTGFYDYVVFKKEDAITMSSEAFNILRNVIAISSIVTQDSPYDVFYNAKGPVPATQGEIYIECQPTGGDGEVLTPVKLGKGGIIENETLKTLFSYTLVKILVGALVMIIIWKAASKVINGIASHAAHASHVVLNQVPKVDV